MQEVVVPSFKPAALNLIKHHKEAGDHVMIVTATNEFVTRPIANALGVEALIAVELERDSKGWITGEISGTPSFKDGKVKRVAQWLADNHTDWQSVNITFYSDSVNDLPLLEKAQTPVATNPDARLRQIATDRGWRILELFT
jgi:HAD superfamily hydrolase (TIGR01490 family)